ncbi:MAG: hypothetical protein EXS10_09320 [Phycisphaerales bacterium]|nr:hypothetical protein [Phycisphaerales bacterium]
MQLHPFSSFLASPLRCGAVLALFTALTLSTGCKSNTRYVDAGSNDVIVSAGQMNVQDWSLLADQCTQSMISAGVLQRYGDQSKPAGLLLNALVNETTEQFDGDAILKKIRIALLNTGRVEVIMTAGPGGRAEDPIAQSAQQSKAFMAAADNQMMAQNTPDLTLTAKLLQNQIKASGDTQSTYILQMTLTDTTTGRGIWEGEANVMKRGGKATIGF